MRGKQILSALAYLIVPLFLPLPVCIVHGKSIREDKGLEGKMKRNRRSRLTLVPAAFFPGLPSMVPLTFSTLPLTLSVTTLPGAFFLWMVLVLGPPVVLVVVVVDLPTRPAATFLSRGLLVLAVVRFLVPVVVVDGVRAASILAGSEPVLVRVVAGIFGLVSPFGDCLSFL